MPYKKTDDLPSTVQHVLPTHAQEIYLSSFNNAYEEYKNRKKRQDPSEDLETICHKVAWSAVKRKYHKNAQDKWVENSL